MKTKLVGGMNNIMNESELIQHESLEESRKDRQPRDIPFSSPLLVPFNPPHTSKNERSDASFHRNASNIQPQNKCNQEKSKTK